MEVPGIYMQKKKQMLQSKSPKELRWSSRYSVKLTNSFPYTAAQIARGTFF